MLTVQQITRERAKFEGKGGKNFNCILKCLERIKKKKEKKKKEKKKKNLKNAEDILQLRRQRDFERRSRGAIAEDEMVKEAGRAVIGFR